MTFQKSALRILLLISAVIFAIAEIHSFFSSWNSGDYFFFVINTACLSLALALLYLSKHNTQVASVLFITTLVASNLLLLTLSNTVYAEKFAIISLYSLPLITRLLFSFRASLIAIVINIYPFYLLTADSITLKLNEVEPSFYFQLLTFATLNLGLPLAVSKIISSLENNASYMRVLYKKLNENYELYEEFFEHTGTATLLCHHQGKLLKVNQIARDLLNNTEDLSKEAVFSDTNISNWLTPLEKSDRYFWRQDDIECTLKHKTDIHIKIQKTTLTKNGHYVIHLQNTTDLKAIQQQLETTQQTNSRLAHFDILTLLPNHSNFCKQVNQSITKTNKHLSGAMFIIRISQFKLLNKQYGKDNANKVILNFSKILQSKVTDQAVIGRLRGVKFAGFIPLNQTYLVQKNLSALITSFLPKQLIIEGNTLNMDYQVGIAYYHVNEGTAEELLEQCEMALEYSNSIEKLSYYNHKLESKLIEDHKLGIKLNSAIKNKEISLWLQPQVSPTGQIVSFEALARWEIRPNSFVSPIVFIKMAEELGLLPILAENLVKELVITLSEWQKEGIHTSIAFNLAGQELMNDHFYALLMTLITDKPWISKMLELEITETSTVMTHPLIHKRLRSLSQYGYGIAIDDFGTGQASLGQLVDIPANILKIDRRFITPLPEDQRHIDIVQSTIQLANSLNMKVIAEGIENKQQANLLTSMGCHTLQGFYYAKPSPMTEWTKNNNEKAKELRMVY